MEDMLRRANQGLLSTAISVDQLWDRYCVNWVEVRRLELELGVESDHDQAYTWNLPPSEQHKHAWTRLRVLRDRGVIES